MEFGLMTEPQVGMTYAEVLAAARLAEDLGLEVFGRSDHLAFPRFAAPHATEAFATLAGLARETKRVRLMVLVSPLTFRHPAVIAKAAATIDEMSGGRLVLGLGTGWMEEEHAAFGLPFPPWAERFARLEEALQYLRAALGKTAGGFEGSPLPPRRRPGPPPAPPGPCPWSSAAPGPGAPRAWRAATPTSTTSPSSPWPTSRPASPPPGRRRRRPVAAPEDLVISVMAPAISGPDEAAYRRHLEAVADADPFGRTPEALEARLRERGLPIGPAPEARRALDGLAALGVSRFYLQHLGPFDGELLDATFSALRD